MVGEIPFGEIVTACSVILEAGAKEVQVFYSAEDKYSNKKVFEITVITEDRKGDDGSNTDH